MPNNKPKKPTIENDNIKPSNINIDVQLFLNLKILLNPNKLNKAIKTEGKSKIE